MTKYILTFLIFLNSLLFCEDFSRVYVTFEESDPAANSVLALDPATNQIVGSISFPDDL